MSRLLKCYAECHYAELNVIRLSVVRISVVRLSVLRLSVVRLNVIRLSVVAPNNKLECFIPETSLVLASNDLLTFGLI